MDGIPPTRDSDSEDVIWALETAESLWKRQARVDAIVWLRRAAQSAADSGDDDRAAGLTRDAAALTETFAFSSSQMRTAPPASGSVRTADGDIDDLLEAGAEELDDSDSVSLPPPTPMAGPDYPPTVPLSSKPRPPFPPRRAAPAAPATVPAFQVPRMADVLPSSELEGHPTVPPDSMEPEVAEAATAGPESILPESDPFDIDGITRMGPDALSPLDLANLDALANVSEDQREALARSASVILCASGVVAPAFALALVLEGEVTATTVDGNRVIARVGPGALIHARGTLDTTRPLLVAITNDDTTLALWSDKALNDALSTSPWAFEDLRAEGDRLQAWAEVAESALAASLHDDVRLRLFGKLVVRTFAAGDELVAEGDAVQGLFLVGAGTIAIGGTDPRELTSGEFVFPGAALTAARAESTARAGAGGAVVLVADRKTTQELCSTEPLLLELLAGM